MVLSFVSIEYQDTTFFHKLLIIARRKKRRGGSAHSVDVSCYIDDKIFWPKTWYCGTRSS